MSSTNRKLTIALVGFVALRIVFNVAVGYREIPKGVDAESYDSYARTILDGREWLSNPDFRGHVRAPGYPIFLAVVYAVFGRGNLVAVYVIHALLGGLTLIYVFKLAQLLFGGRVAALSLLWSGVYVYYLWSGAHLWRENLIFPLMVFMFYELFVLLQSNGPLLKNASLWKFVVAFSVLIHVDARYLFFVPCVSVVFVAFRGVRRGIVEYVLATAALVLLLIPWTVRNYVAYDGFVLINTRTLDLRPGAKRDPTMSRRFDKVREAEGAERRTDPGGPGRYPLQEELRQIELGENPKHRSPEELATIRAGIAPPSTYIGQKIYWFKEFWRPARSKGDYSPPPSAKFTKWSMRQNIMGTLGYGLLLPFALLGLILLVRQRNRAWVFLLLPIATQTVLHVMLWARNRYRFPIDAFIIIFAMYGICAIYCYVRRRYDRRLFG